MEQNKKTLVFLGEVGYYLVSLWVCGCVRVSERKESQKRSNRAFSRTNPRARGFDRLPVHRPHVASQNRDRWPTSEYLLSRA